MVLMVFVVMVVVFLYFMFFFCIFWIDLIRKNVVKLRRGMVARITSDNSVLK